MGRNPSGDSILGRSVSDTTSISFARFELDVILLPLRVRSQAEKRLRVSEAEISGRSIESDP